MVSSGTVFLHLSRGAKEILTELGIHTLGDLRTRTPRDIYNSGVPVVYLYPLRNALLRRYGEVLVNQYGWTREAIKELETRPPAQRIPRSVRV